MKNDAIVKSVTTTITVGRVSYIDSKNLLIISPFSPKSYEIKIDDKTLRDLYTVLKYIFEEQGNAD